MGFHHCDTVRGTFPETARAMAGGASLILFLSLVSHPAVGTDVDTDVAGMHREYRCTPEIKHECSMDRCEKTAHGFQDVESFIYDTRTGKISACLWTNCYSGAVTLFKDAASGTTTAIARLKPTAHPGNEPITVSLTVDDAGMEGRGDAKEDENRKGNGGSESRFTAVWGYGSDRLTFDMGRCVLRHVR